ncbi:hypothetical protein HYV80_04735 [Candidatus Woesearchaeota archaeon]|nr:hypothetical protein [Candidatus Woesearchaeota archaeon]
MKNIMHWLAPKKAIFDMLAGQSANVLVSANELKSIVDDYSKLDRSERKSRVQHIKKLKGQSDELHQEIVLKLGSGGLSGKNNMYSIALLLREAADLLADLSSKLMALGIERIDSHMLKLVNAICVSAEGLNKAFGAKKPDEALAHYKKLQILKDDSEDICNEALSELFHFYKNSIDIMKCREIYRLLNGFIEKCRNAGEFVYVWHSRR